MRLTLNRINKELAKHNIDAVLYKGEGYFYFVGDDVDYAIESGIYGVYRLNDLSLEDWVDCAKSLKEESEKYQVKTYQ